MNKPHPPLLGVPNPLTLGPPLPPVPRRTARISDDDLHHGVCIWTALMNDTSIQRVPPKHLYPLADRHEINGVVILGLLVLQDLLMCWPRSAENVGSHQRMGHPVEPCDVPLLTVPVLCDPSETVLLRYHMMLPVLPYGSELHSGHCVGSSLKG